MADPMLYVEADDLAHFEQRYNAELEGGAVCSKTRFEYAWALVHSRYKEDIVRGLRQLHALLEDDAHNRDYLYYTALGHYRRGDFEDAHACVDSLLAVEPANGQALKLKAMIDDAVYKNGLLGMGLVGAVFGLGTVLAASAVIALKNARR